MKTKYLPQTLQKQAALRHTKTPAILAEQAVLNGILLRRKGGSHHSQIKKREQLLNIQMTETMRDLNLD
jgi:hypothetical protein